MNIIRSVLVRTGYSCQGQQGQRGGRGHWWFVVAPPPKKVYICDVCARVGQDQGKVPETLLLIFWQLRSWRETFLESLRYDSGKLTVTANISWCSKRSFVRVRKLPTAGERSHVCGGCGVIIRCLAVILRSMYNAASQPTMIILLQMSEYGSV